VLLAQTRLLARTCSVLLHTTAPPSRLYALDGNDRKPTARPFTTGTEEGRPSCVRTSVWHGGEQEQPSCVRLFLVRDIVTRRQLVKSDLPSLCCSHGGTIAAIRCTGMSCSPLGRSARSSAQIGNFTVKWDSFDTEPSGRMARCRGERGATRTKCAFLFGPSTFQLLNAACERLSDTQRSCQTLRRVWRPRPCLECSS